MGINSTKYDQRFEITKYKPFVLYVFVCNQKHLQLLLEYNICLKMWQERSPETGIFLKCLIWHDETLNFSCRFWCHIKIFPWFLLWIHFICIIYIGSFLTNQLHIIHRAEIMNLFFPSRQDDTIQLVFALEQTHNLFLYMCIYVNTLLTLFI